MEGGQHTSQEDRGHHLQPPQHEPPLLGISSISYTNTSSSSSSSSSSDLSRCNAPPISHSIPAENESKGKSGDKEKLLYCNNCVGWGRAIVIVVLAGAALS